MLIMVFTRIIYIMVFMWIVSFGLVISMKKKISVENCPRYFEICKDAF